MIHIDINQSKIQEARDYHYKIIRYIIKKKLNGNNFKETPPIKGMKIKQVYRINADISRYLNNEENLKNLLIGNPKKLEDIKDKFTLSRHVKSIKRIISYDNWKDYERYGAYDLAKHLDIPTCPYCNRMYTKTVIKKSGKKVTRPAFDHWFPKSKYPLLALSFHNLIPSCTVCNSGIKGSKEYTLDELFHPYYNKGCLKYKFSYEHKNYDDCSFKINSENDFSKNSINTFELEEIYKTHEDEIKDLLKIRQAYSESYIDMLEKQLLSGITLSREEIYRLAFGVHYEEAQFDRRPLSKMKKDILTELGIIKEK